MKKGRLSTILLLIVILVGVCFLLYPTVSDWWNSTRQSRAVLNYNSAVQNLTEKDYSEALSAAQAYNEALSELAAPLSLYDQIDGYDDLLDISGTGVIGYLSIPSLDVELPIYHGTSDAVLNVAIGHYQGSSLPIGGESTHAVLSSHRGLPSAKLFTDLDKMQIGDTFSVTVLNRLLTYQVDQIRIVTPEQTEDLAIVPGEDYVTLLTCTPYGINTHRLLVRGKRIENPEGTDTVVISNAIEIDSAVIASLIAAPVLVVWLSVVLVRYRRRQ